MIVMLVQVYNQHWHMSPQMEMFTSIRIQEHVINEMIKLIKANKLTNQAAPLLKQ